MKEDELTKLEESRDVKRILETSKDLYDEEDYTYYVLLIHLVLLNQYF